MRDFSFTPSSSRKDLPMDESEKNAVVNPVSDLENVSPPSWARILVFFITIILQALKALAKECPILKK